MSTRGTRCSLGAGLLAAAILLTGVAPGAQAALTVGSSLAKKVKEQATAAGVACRYGVNRRRGR